MHILSPCWTSERLVDCTMTGHQLPLRMESARMSSSQGMGKGVLESLVHQPGADMGEKVARAWQGTRHVFMLFTVSPQLTAVSLITPTFRVEAVTCLKLYSEEGVRQKICVRAWLRLLLCLVVLTRSSTLSSQEQKHGGPRGAFCMPELCSDWGHRNTDGGYLFSGYMS